MRLAIQLFLLGLVFGSGFGLIGLGILLIYRTTRVLNLAHGAMAMFPAYIVFQSHSWGVPAPLALLLGVGLGALLGLGTERALRPLRNLPAGQLIATAGILLVLTATAVAIWSTEPRQAVSAFPDTLIPIAGTGIYLSWEQIGVAIVSLALAAGLTAFVNFTSVGLKLRAVAEDPERSELAGVDAGAVSSIAWAAGAAMAAVAGILLSPLLGLHPFILTFVMIYAFAAALFGGLRSFGLTLAGGLFVGVLYSELRNLPVLSEVPGLREAAVFAAVVGFMALRSKELGITRT